MNKGIEVRLPQGVFQDGVGVFYSRAPVVAVGPETIAWLKSDASLNPRKCSRLCAHPAPSAAVHEMLIVLCHDVYVRPHRHANKSESFHRIEGEAWIVLFGDWGAIDAVIGLDGSGTAPFFFRIPCRTYHAFVIRSPWLVFHETTAGPFERSQMEFAPWSPDERDVAAVTTFSAELERRIQSYLTNEARPAGLER